MAVADGRYFENAAQTFCDETGSASGTHHTTIFLLALFERYTPPGFAVPLATKDLRLALAAAEKSPVPMPAASLVHDHLVELAARGWSELDWSALGLLAAVDAGLSEAA